MCALSLIGEYNFSLLTSTLDKNATKNILFNNIPNIDNSVLLFKMDNKAKSKVNSPSIALILTRLDA